MHPANALQPAFVASLLSALVAASLCCHWLVPPTLAISTLFLVALVYVSVTVLIGATGAWFYWNPVKQGSIVSPEDFIIRCGAGWVWAPAVVILIQQGSFLATAFATLGAATLGASLRFVICEATAGQPPVESSGEKRLFAESLQSVSLNWHPPAVAVCVYTGSIALANQQLLPACMLLSVAAFLLAWQLSELGSVPNARKLRLLGGTAFVATLITTMALWMNVCGDSSKSTSGARTARGHFSRDSAYRQNKKRETADQAIGAMGYEGIILWPLYPKHVIAAPVASHTALQRFQAAKSVAIPFDGFYSYFQPPETWSDSQALLAHDSPLNVNVHATNFMPLTMEARQTLGTEIRVSTCREIQVTIANRDDRSGYIYVRMQLSDSEFPGRPSLDLGEQPIMSSEESHFRPNLSSIRETLHFPIPSRSALRRFDQIKLVFRPDRVHLEIGAKVAVQQFEFLSR
jgi:hypothetical protein